MIKKLAVIALLLIISISKAQNMSVSGMVMDTASRKPLTNAVIMAVKMSDSTLINYTRSKEDGSFVLENLPIDTIEVTVSHPKFGDNILYVIGSNKNRQFNFGKIVLPPKSVSLTEVTIFAFKDPIYYKGDTLVYTADSFKVKPNATVEDLLKKLPGIKVDANGKITSQGKEVSKVLVDGDEFFGTDPTMATKNLAANSIESVQVYEKKEENASAENTSDETIKVMNLKLKEDAKKGYFGKASAGSDFQKFYEGELLLNRFRNKQKISVFALGANTPKTGFGWSEIEKYGLDNERNYSWDEETGNFIGNQRGQGIPRTLNTGIYYTDKLNNKTKINSNYSYKNNLIVSKTEDRSQYYLTDTSYVTNNKSINSNENQSHNLNLTLVNELDSFTKVTIAPKVSYNISSNTSSTNNNFESVYGAVSRETENSNTSNSNSYDIKSYINLNRTFRKKDRNLSLSYNFDLGHSDGSGFLKTTNTVYSTTVSALSNIDQKKVNNSDNQYHNASIRFFEPITKKIKTEVNYEFTYNNNSQYKRSLNSLNNEYSILDSVYSNDFRNTKMINQAKVSLIYEVKKYRISLGTRGRAVNLINTNNYTGKVIEQNVNNILPFMNYNYNFSQNTHLYLNYNTNSQQPNINQLQPLPNNANQNFITLGNPNLKPTFNHQLNLNFNTYRSVSGKYFWSGGNFNYTQNAFSSSLVYDSLGRSVSTPINVDGNYNGSSWVGFSLPMFSRVVSINPNLNSITYNNINYINNVKNITRNTSLNSELEVNVNLEKYIFQIGGRYNYNVPYSTLNKTNNKPYTSQEYRAMFRIELPKKFFIESDATYNVNSRRAAGYNINYFIINASASKNFGKLENLIVSLKAYDILNQNISASRNVYDNIITDSKTNIISRYFLFALTYKFNSQKTKDEEEY